MQRRMKNEWMKMNFTLMYDDLGFRAAMRMLDQRSDEKKYENAEDDHNEEKRRTKRIIMIMMIMMRVIRKE